MLLDRLLLCSEIPIQRMSDEWRFMTGSLDSRIRVLVVSLPGIMQNLLRETFTSRSDVDVVGVASGGLSAVGMIRQEQPDLVVIDSNLPQAEMRELILWLKKGSQRICSLALVETTQQLNNAATAGADIILRSYSLSGSIDSVIGKLQKSGTNKHQ